jgi:WD40 repeat protein
VWDEESGVLHREFQGPELSTGGLGAPALATFLSEDGQQPRLTARSTSGHVCVYDPEAGSVLHRLDGHINYVLDLACLASSSAAPHHPRLVSAGWDRTAKVWDGETGGWLADLWGHQSAVDAVVVWKEHTGERDHDRIATAGADGKVKIWDGEALTLLHDLDPKCDVRGLLAFQSAEEPHPHRLLVALGSDRGVQLWEPEEGRLLHDGINRDCSLSSWHLFESAQGRHLLAIIGSREHPGAARRTFLDVWDLGKAPAPEVQLRPAHHRG